MWSNLQCCNKESNSSIQILFFLKTAVLSRSFSLKSNLNAEFAWDGTFEASWGLNLNPHFWINHDFREKKRHARTYTEHIQTEVNCFQFYVFSFQNNILQDAGPHAFVKIGLTAKPAGLVCHLHRLRKSLRRELSRRKFKLGRITTSRFNETRKFQAKELFAWAFIR